MEGKERNRIIEELYRDYRDRFLNYDPRDDSNLRKIKPEVAIRYLRRFGGRIMLGEEFRSEPTRIVPLGPTLYNNEEPCSPIAIIKRGTFMEDALAWGIEKWEEKGLPPNPNAIDPQSYRDARRFARKLRRIGVPYTDIPYIIKEIWGERIGELVAGLRGTEYYLCVPGVEE